MVFTPQQFAKKTGLSYDHVLQMCKTGKVKALKTEGGHFKIPEKELDKFTTEDYATKDEYLRVVRDNERLKTIILQLQNYVSNLDTVESEGNYESTKNYKSML
jgi:excisionase family DNA binding protein